MRVLLVMEATIGGTRRHIVDLARGLAARGVQTHLVASAEREPAFRGDLALLAEAGVHASELPMVRAVRPLTDARHYRALKRRLEDVRPDIVHTHSSKAGALGRMASLAVGIGKRVHTPHTFAFLFSAMFSPGKRALFRRVEGFLGKRTDLTIAVGESEAETIRRSGVVPAERVRVVPNGIDAGPWSTEERVPRSELGVANGSPLLVLVGLLNHAKGQDVAIEALTRPGLEDAHLCLAGIGDWEAELQDLSRSRGVAERVRFLGWREDVPALLGAADLVLVPSRWEGMPYIVLEAQARGVPVVGTRVDGVRELVQEGETGFFADVDDPDDLARAIRAALALSPEERAAVGAAGRAHVRDEHGLDRMVDRMIEVYEEVL